MSARCRLAALALLLAARPAAAGPPPPPLDDLLERAARYVADLEERLAVVVGEESYRQALYVGPERSARDRRRRRTVNSPTLALACLHRRNQARFAFRVAGADTKAGVACWKLRLHERLGSWLPSEMWEAYENPVRGVGQDRVEARATYTGWRRATAQVDDIILPPAVKP